MEERNMELLIEEIEKRPALYNKQFKEYSYVDMKRQLWDDICRVVIRHWDGLSIENKIKRGLDVQRKWQSLRNCFARELRNQRSAAKSGPPAKRRRKYVYYDKLLFLLPTIEQRRTTTNARSNDDSDEGGSESTNMPKSQASTQFTSFPWVSKTFQPVSVDDVSSISPCTGPSVLPKTSKVVPELLPFLLPETNISASRTKKRNIDMSEAEDACCWRLQNVCGKDSIPIPQIHIYHTE